MNERIMELAFDSLYQTYKEAEEADMTDRELLELAAKAAGMANWEWVDSWSSMAQKREAGGFYFDSHWNPLTNDGDALRLAVKLDIQIAKNSCNTAAIAFKAPGLQINEWFDQHPDQYAATRRAIVRAAAEIGKGMK